MNTGPRITVFAAALAATFGTAYAVGSGVGSGVPEGSSEPTSAVHGRHAAGAQGSDAGAKAERETESGSSGEPSEHTH